jgi:hypothetical protein
VPPLEDPASTTQKRLGRRVRNVFRSVVTATRAVIDGTRRAIGAAANLVTRETQLHIHTRLDRRNLVPLVRGWDDGKDGFGKPLTLKGVRVNVSGQSRLALYKTLLDENGEAVVAVPRSLRVNICFEADSPAAKFEFGLFLPVLHCWPKHTPRGPTDHLPTLASDGSVRTKAVGETEFYAMAQLIDARVFQARARLPAAEGERASREAGGHVDPQHSGLRAVLGGDQGAHVGRRRLARRAQGGRREHAAQRVGRLGCARVFHLHGHRHR